MEHDEIKLETYTNVLNELPRHGQSHLLLGNGFNTSLGIRTNYESIFNEMKKEYSEYENIKEKVKARQYDIEVIIDELKNQINESADYKKFLSQYISKKVKFDFMKATQSIVIKEVKNVYQEKNQGIYLLLKNFTNYFTLNYDPFLYLLLMKFKKDNSIEAIALQNTLKFQEENLTQTKNGIYHKIEIAYEKGELEITVDEHTEKRNLHQIPKTSFITQIKEYFKNENWKNKDIEKAVTLLWNNKKKGQKTDFKQLSLYDGFSNSSDPIYNIEQRTQNLFFLHGAFHIYEKGGVIYKITRKNNEPLYERIINSEGENIVCVLESSSSDKMRKINQYPYLQIAYEKLSTLEGSLVILGCSLSGNDRHIFEQINKSSIHSIYISSCKKTKLSDYYKAIDLFPSKSIILFNYNDISYE